MTIFPNLYPIKGKIFYYKLLGSYKVADPFEAEINIAIPNNTEDDLFLFEFQGRKMCYNIQKEEMSDTIYRNHIYFRNFYGDDFHVTNFMLHYLEKKGSTHCTITCGFWMPELNSKFLVHGFLKKIDVFLKGRKKNGPFIEYCNLTFFQILNT